MGEVQYPTDASFEQFVEMKWGVRAAFVILRRYIKRYGLRTIPAIVSRWAPRSENNTLNYIKKVSELSGFDTSYEFTWENKAVMRELFLAMCIVENGQPIPYKDIEDGYDLVERT